MQSSHPPLIEKESDSYIRISQKASSQAVLSQAISKKLFIIPVVFVFLRAPGTYRYFLSIHDCSSDDDNSNSTNKYCGVTEDCFRFGGNYYILPLQVKVIHLIILNYFLLFYFEGLL